MATTSKTPRQFDDWSEAFDYCRRTVGHPVVVIVNGEKWKLYPSGRAERKEREP